MSSWDDDVCNLRLLEKVRDKPRTHMSLKLRNCAVTVRLKKLVSAEPKAGRAIDFSTMT